MPDLRHARTCAQHRYIQGKGEGRKREREGGKAGETFGTQPAEAKAKKEKEG